MEPVGCVSQVAGEDSDGLLSEFQSVLETVLKFVSHFTRVANKFSMKQTAKFWRALQHKSHDMLDKVGTGRWTFIKNMI